tara:strand:+ start:26 stop:718 length:693 start_codon:yes stop_codon:yes gene_type:complete
MLNEEFRYKYLKYKQKYLELKNNMKGSGDLSKKSTMTHNEIKKIQEEIIRLKKLLTARLTTTVMTPVRIAPKHEEYDKSMIRNLKLLVLCADTKSINSDKSLDIINNDLLNQVINITYVGNNINHNEIKEKSDDINREYFNLKLENFGESNKSKFDIIVNEGCPFLKIVSEPFSNILVNNLKINGLFYTIKIKHLGFDIGEKINYKQIGTSRFKQTSPFIEYIKISNKVI